MVTTKGKAREAKDAPKTPSGSRGGKAVAHSHRRLGATIHKFGAPPSGRVEIRSWKGGDPSGELEF